MAFLPCLAYCAAWGLDVSSLHPPMCISQRFHWAEETGYLFEKVVTNTLSWKIAPWQINCEQCCRSEGATLKSRCWWQKCATASAVHLLPAVQSWEGRWSAPWLLRHAILHGWITVPALSRYIFLGLLLLNGRRLHSSHPQRSCSAVHLISSNSIFPLSLLSAGHPSWCLHMKNRLTLRQSHLFV